MSEIIVLPSHTPEEKRAVISHIAHRVWSHNKTRQAFYHLFGTQLPHDCIERLIRMNSRALTDDFNARIFKLLSGNANDFYGDLDFIEIHNMRYAHEWLDGTILSRWEKLTIHPNPHHIVPESRGWINNPKNFWKVDRLTHNDFHTVFHNLKPIEQVVVLLNFYKNILSQDFASMLRRILFKIVSEPDCYKKGVIAWLARKTNWD